MSTPRIKQEPPSRSTSKSPLPSPGLPGDEWSESQVSHPTGVAFVPFSVGTASGISNETRRAVRVQAAKSSAAARKRTIARKLAGKRSTSYDDTSTASTPESDRGRRLSVSSASDLANLSLTAAASPSPARSISSGQLEPFRLYPISRWHPQIPSLVDYFMQNFAPEATTDMLGRDAMRSQLWPEALASNALFHAILLTVASHALASRAQPPPISLLALLKQSTIESINSSIARSEGKVGIGDGVIGAIALMGAWELDYGNSTTYDTHMRGLETIVNMRGGLSSHQASSAGLTPLAPAVIHLVLNAGHDLALYASKPSHFQEMMSPRDTTNLHSALPQGFENLRTQRLVLPSLLQLASRLAIHTPQDPGAFGRLHDTQQSLTEWSLALATRVSYCPTQTLLEDDIKQQASALIRLAGLTLCEYYQLALGMQTGEGLQALYDEGLLLQPEVLLGTLYEEVSFWALFMICSTTGRCETRHMRALKRLQLELAIESWTTARNVLGRYVYAPSILDSRAYNLWEAIENSMIARKGPAGTKEPNRFAKGIQHPTIQVGEAIAAEEEGT